MNIPLIPERLEDWTLELIDSLTELKDLESETFDLKKEVTRELYHHICAMANSSGGYIVLGIEEIKSGSEPQIISGFKKVGFKIGKEDEIGKQISNSVYCVEPIPKAEFTHIKDKDNRFYTVLHISSEDINKPYFTKSGRCYIRIGNSSKPATRSTILNLAANKIISRDVILQHTKYLEEIYKKLTGIRPHPKNGLLSLEAPTNYNDYLSNILFIFGHEGTPVDYVDIKYMKHTDWAWKEILELIAKYTEITNSMKSTIEEFIADKMKSRYDTFKPVSEIEYSPYNCYSVSNISELTFRQFITYNKNDKKPGFSFLRSQILEGDGYFAIYNLIRSQSKEDLEPDKLIRILQDVCESTDIMNQHKQLDKILDETYSLCEIFSKALRTLIDDFDGGDIIKGSCKLGF
jgi:hypothetical protein